LKESKPVKAAKPNDTRFFFIQLGYDARLKSLAIIDMLRGENIHVHQSLSRDKISAQLAAAEKIAAHYLLIVGQKEAIDNSVTIRHMDTLVQETVEIASLINYLKKLM
jgi:histidyl-tRNA synthetase